jgi:hypothetical protein
MTISELPIDSRVVVLFPTGHKRIGRIVKRMGYPLRCTDEKQIAVVLYPVNYNDWDRQTISTSGEIRRLGVNRPVDRDVDSEHNWEYWFDEQTGQSTKKDHKLGLRIQIDPEEIKATITELAMEVNRLEVEAMAKWTARVDEHNKIVESVTKWYAALSPEDQKMARDAAVYHPEVVVQGYAQG